MIDFPYVNARSRFEDFLTKIQDVGVPDKVDNKWLASIGFENSDDRRFIRILKFVGFFDESDKPNDSWKSFRTDRGKAAMGQRIKIGYSELFKVYSDADQRPDADLRNFFKRHSNAGNQVIARTVSTFQVLCTFASFVPVEEETAADGQTAIQQSRIPNSDRIESQPPKESETSRVTPSLHIDVQIHISSDMSDEKIDRIFESMAKYLYNKDVD